MWLSEVLHLSQPQFLQTPCFIGHETFAKTTFGKTLRPEAMLFTSVYTQLPVPYDWASNGDCNHYNVLLLRPCAVPDYYNLVDAADTPSLSISEVIRLKHVAKVFIHDDGSSPMSTGQLLICCPHAVHMLLTCPQVMLMPFAVSEEIRYKHIAQSAISDMTLVSDPHRP